MSTQQMSALDPLLTSEFAGKTSQMRKDEPQNDAHDTLVLASWRYAVLFSLLLSSSLWLFAALWMWLRDGRLHDIDSLLVTWIFFNAVMIPAMKWDSSRR